MVAGGDEPDNRLDIVVAAQRDEEAKPVLDPRLRGCEDSQPDRVGNRKETRLRILAAVRVVRQIGYGVSDTPGVFLDNPGCLGSRQVRRKDSKINPGETLGQRHKARIVLALGRETVNHDHAPANGSARLVEIGTGAPARGLDFNRPAGRCRGGLLEFTGCAPCFDILEQPGRLP